MCSIIASFKVDKIKELAALNAYRGQHSHSIYVFEKYNNVVLYKHRATGPLNIDEHNLPDGYIICHQQAPTTENKNNSIHPAQLKDELLWHNGILKEKTISELQTKYDSNVTWDTKLLLLHIINNKKPDNIDGTFSCIYYNGKKLHMFRNEISPLFYDKDLNISSTKFENSISVEPNKVLELSLNLSYNISYNTDNEFKTVENPYYFGA